MTTATLLYMHRPTWRDSHVERPSFRDWAAAAQADAPSARIQETGKHPARGSDTRSSRRLRPQARRQTTTQPAALDLT